MLSRIVLFMVASFIAGVTPGAGRDASKEPEKAGFRGMVGFYKNGESQLPVLLLSQPAKDDQTVLCDAYRERLRANSATVIL